MDDREREESNNRDFDVEIAQVSRSGLAKAPQRGLSPPQRFWRLVSGVGVVLLALALLLLNLSGRIIPSPFLPPAPGPLVLRPQTQGMACLIDGAWSPQSSRLALLGKQFDNNCPDAFPRPKAGLLIIYDARSGKLLTTLHPDTAVVPAVQAFTRRIDPQAPAISAADVASVTNYQHVLWSSDGTRLALTFLVDIPDIVAVLLLPNGEPAVLAGVLLIDANGAHPQVFAHLVSPLGQSPLEWDLSSGGLLTAPSPPYSCTHRGCSGPFPPALVYHWRPDGALDEDTPLTMTTPPPVPPLVPVGNPDGGGTFTLWQPGFTSGVSRLGPNGLAHLAGAYFWTTQILAWSPDARYLLTAIVPASIFELPDFPRPTAEDFAAYHISAPWLLPLRDLGLQRALETVDPDDQVGLALAWSPNGRTLASYPPETQPTPHPLTLYDCATGHVLASLLPPAASGPALTGQSLLLRWSPDGSRLLLFGARLAAAIVWGPGQLPRLPR